MSCEPVSDSSKGTVCVCEWVFESRSFTPCCHPQHADSASLLPFFSVFSVMSPLRPVSCSFCQLLTNFVGSYPDIWHQARVHKGCTNNAKPSASVLVNFSIWLSKINLLFSKVRAPRGMEVKLEWKATHTAFTQETRVHIPCENTCQKSFLKPKHIYFVPKFNHT